jgi:two-component system, chemotaxis family, sensor kinase CheA
LSNPYIDEPMLEAYVYETTQIVESLEQLMISSEKNNEFTIDSINEIFRFMHTIKGSSAMMMFNGISTLAHRIEDFFYLLREKKDINYDFSSLVDIILESIDFFKVELLKLKNGEEPDGEITELISKVEFFIQEVKSRSGLKEDNDKSKKVSAEQKYYIRPSTKEVSALYYKACMRFKADSEMENIRAYTVVHNIVELVEEVFYRPNDIIENDTTSEEIKLNGFHLVLQSKTEQSKIKTYLENTVFLESLDFEEILLDEYKQCALDYQEKDISDDIKIPEISKKFEEIQRLKQEKQEKQEKGERSERQEGTGTSNQGIISVNVDKLDKLMDMVGELVIAEAMVSQNPEVTKLEIESFDKSSRQLHKISTELQDMVMAIRMVPLSTTFLKMHRIVRDMTKKLNKNVELVVYGEETEVDKNIIEKISDPLMHLIRNALDHGIEDEMTRLALGKDRQGIISLEAKNSGSDVLIIIRDDGKGLDKTLLYNKALNQGLVNKAIEDMSDREVYRLILHPGFSTKEQVTEFSGRGVGMDVVSKNIESIGGTVIVDSIPSKGTTIVLKIPLTLAIIEGMNIRVGQSRFTLPIVAIKQSFRPKKSEIIKDTEGQEMIMVRGLCYPILRLHELYQVQESIQNMDEGILIMVEDNERSCCLFADELIGQQQVVVKSLPSYIKKYRHIKGIGGCTLLGDGNISLILDIGSLDLAAVASN